MHRLAPQQGFAADLRAALNSPSKSDSLQALIELAQLDVNYVQAIQLNGALRSLRLGDSTDVPKCRLAILASSTMDHLAPAITVAALRWGILLEAYVAPFGQYRQELLDSESALWEFNPDFILFSISARDVLSGATTSSSADDVSRAISAHVSELNQLWNTAQKINGATVLQQTALNIGDTLFGNLDRTLPGAPTQLVRQFNAQMVHAAASSAVLTLDLERPLEKLGLDFWFDNAKWLQAKMEISPAAALHYGDLVAQIVAAQRGLTKKCLVLDLDNTLWGGVIGDDGIDNIVLGEGSGLGEAFLAFQRYVKQLKERGIILAVCSKNEHDTAAAAFTDHPEMMLRADDLAAFVANWNDKATNLIDIAKQLNIGLDSLVFVDDNPAERALIRQSLPMVAVPELPEDPALYVRCLSGAGYFESVSFTGDDLQRASQYTANKQRRELEVSAQSIEDYLASLEMRMTASSFKDVDLPRISQLINKTNQFNTTTRRRTLEQVRAIQENPDNMTLQVRLADRFGDNGLVSAMILMPYDGAPDTYEIETWVMSCRVFGRQLEHEILNSAVLRAQRAGARHLTASFIPTEKNARIKTLYPELGFSPLQQDTPDGKAATRWSLDLAEFSFHPTQIDKSDDDND